MKRTIQLMMTIALLLMTAAVTVKAQQTFGGKLTCNGASIKYSVAGVFITEKKKEDTGAKLTLEIKGTVKPGSTVNVSMERTAGQGESKMAIDYDYIRKGELRMTAAQYQLQPKTSDSKTISIASNADSYYIVMAFRNKNGNSWSDITVELSLKVSDTTPSTTVTPQSSSTPSALRTFNGTYERTGAKIGYSFTANTVTSKVDKGHCLLIEGTIKKGATFKATVKKLMTMSNKNGVEIVHDGVKKRGTGTVNYSTKVPDDISSFWLELADEGDEYGRTAVLVHLKVVDTPTGSSMANSNWTDVSKHNRCKYCNGQFSGYYTKWQQAAYIRCQGDPKGEKGWIAMGSGIEGDADEDINRYSRSNVTDIIHYNDLIWTNGRDFGANAALSLGLSGSPNTITFKGNTVALLKKRSANGNPQWKLYRGRVVGRSTKLTSKEPIFEMSHCMAKPAVSVYVLEDNGGQSRVYLLSGSMEVTSTKTKKKVTLKPGQVSTVTKDGQMKVQKFDVDAAARKYGISQLAK